MIPKKTLKEKLGIPYGTIFTTDGDNRFYFQKAGDNEYVFRRVSMQFQDRLSTWNEEVWEYDEELTRRFETEYNEIKVIESPPNFHMVSNSEVYWFGLIIDDKFHVCYTYWYERSSDYARYYVGNFFKTKEEAIEKGEKIAREIYDKFEKDRAICNQYKKDTWYVRVPIDKEKEKDDHIIESIRTVNKLGSLCGELACDDLDRIDLKKIDDIYKGINLLLKQFKHLKVNKAKNEKFS